MISSVRHTLIHAKMPVEIAKSCINTCIKNKDTLLSVSMRVFNLGTGVCLIGYGFKEILLDSHPNWFRIRPNEKLSKPVQKMLSAVDWFFMMIRNQPSGFPDKVRFSAHGLLMIGTGVAGSFLALDTLGLISLGQSFRLFNFTACGFFLLGNVVFLEYNIQKFVAATLELKHTRVYQKQAILKQIAAAIGIVSNLAYIATSLATIAAAPFVYPLILSLVGVSTGSLRIFLESYIAWHTSQQT